MICTTAISDNVDHHNFFKSFRNVYSVSVILTTLLIGFVTGNPRVGTSDTAPVTRDTAPATVKGIHRTLSPQVCLRCHDNPLRVHEPRV